MKRHIYLTPAIECIQVESASLMNAGSSTNPTTITNGGNASELGGTPIAD